MKGNIVVYKRILYTVAILSVLIQLFCDFNIGLFEGGVENDIYIRKCIRIRNCWLCAVFLIKGLRRTCVKETSRVKDIGEVWDFNTG